MIITVTQTDIDRGQRHSGTTCPIARAIRRAARRWRWPVSVGPTTVDLGPRQEVALPWRAINFVNNFDGLAPVKPFRFKLVLTKGSK